MGTKPHPDTSTLKTQLTAFFQTERFRKATILHTIAVISSVSSHDWWSVDLRTEQVIHRATEDVYSTYRVPGVLSLEMITEDDLRQITQVAGLPDLIGLMQGNREHQPGTTLEELPQSVQDDLKKLAEALLKHPEMLTGAKQLLRQQL